MAMPRSRVRPDPSYWRSAARSLRRSADARAGQARRAYRNFVEQASRAHLRRARELYDAAQAAEDLAAAFSINPSGHEGGADMR